MAGVIEMDFCIRDVALERFRPRRQEERVVLAPDCEQRRALCAEILLELGIEGDVARVVQEQVELNIVIPRAS